MSDEEENIRQELSEIPLGELQSLRQKVGTKKFDVTFKKRLQTERSLDDMKRVNKHRPREMSSRKPISRFKQVVIVPKKSFYFLDDMKKQEKAELEKQLKKTRKPNAKKKLEVLLQKMESRDINKQKEKEKKDLIKQHKKCERKLTKEGKKPFYLTKALERKVLLAKRYKELKESGQLERVLRKRRKRNAAKDRKRIPNRTSIS